ncbi:hypothetical protein AMATHDRAFT_44353 [Amanita thiersii Skay4041]|uniref:Carbohydrate-binding module family 19 domain-containing protein n=1 Tax=Amanita thiersii Skay4041 TaxID=703135 RepID=A0A2A9P0H4_9AGAR|nr:hypothetical protein AMATHDRAFT_44353 [Amanita thiersii Skay4041]
MVPRYLVAALLLLHSLPALATIHGDNNVSCNAGQFSYKELGICLKYGGDTDKEDSSKNSECPVSTYYWHKSRGCCVPRNPPQEDGPPPQCNHGRTWIKGVHKCIPNPTPTTTYSPSYPSRTPHGDDKHGGYNHAHRFARRRESLQSRLSACPSGFHTCPISGTQGFECIDTDAELVSCGGLYSCIAGQKPSEDGQNCISEY